MQSFVYASVNYDYKAVTYPNFKAYL